MHDSKRPTLRSLRPRALDLSEPKYVQTTALTEERTLPLVVSPAVPGLDPIAWARDHRDWIDRQLDQYGALLFRGFDLEGPQRFQDFAAAAYPSLFSEYGDLPKAGEHIYHVTPYPPDKTILFHNESSHMHRWPTRQLFFCHTPAAAGGATPIVDGRELYRRARPELIAHLVDSGLRYHRRFVPSVDVSWQAFFRAEGKAAVERFCTTAQIDYRWRGDELFTSQWAPGVLRHPRTGAMSLFNQIQLHHSAALEPEVRAELEAMFGKGSLPRSVTFGDGAAIPDEDVHALIELYWQHAIEFDWRHRDVLVIDNTRVAHARRPYSPPRSMFVAIAELSTGSQP